MRRTATLGLAAVLTSLSLASGVPSAEAKGLDLTGKYEDKEKSMVLYLKQDGENVKGAAGSWGYAGGRTVEAAVTGKIHGEVLVFTCEDSWLNKGIGSLQRSGKSWVLQTSMTHNDANAMAAFAIDATPILKTSSKVTKQDLVAFP